MPEPVVPNEPKPISDYLRRRFDEEASAIPAGKRGQIGASITTQGIGIGGAARFGRTRFGDPSVSGWAGKEWGGGGWSAGAKVGLVF